MNYEEAREYMEEVNKLGSIPGLDSIRELLKRAGNPEKGLKYIHVAGTNGKGSVSSFIAAGLKACGYRVGRYVSPTIIDYRERIQVNSSYITKTKTAEYLTTLFNLTEQMKADGLPSPTSFEIETVMAFMYFQYKNCDYVVLECGMGGESDATNIIESPVACVITSVSLDHCAFLGNTVAEIAANKSGIIKPGCFVISSPQCDEVTAVLQKKCAEAGVSFTQTDKEKIKVKKSTLDRQKFDYGSIKNIEISLAGDYQPENAATALECLMELKKRGCKLKDEKIFKGFTEVIWPARFEPLGKKPLVVADGAHNPDAAKRLMNSLSFHFTNRRIVYIMGVLKDKDYDEMIRMTVPKAAHIVTVTPPNKQRALPAFELAKSVKEYNPNVTAADSVCEALEMAILLAGEDGVVLAFGSLSYMGLLKEEYEKRNRNGRRK